MCEIIFVILIFAISNEKTFELGDRINYCGFYFRDSVYSPRNRENKNPAKISRYTVLSLPRVIKVYLVQLKVSPKFPSLKYQ